ncbi:Alpha-2-macroglobulin-like 3 [Homarus americanus]|uniref:Alpha-2-macroglobulin-like 3 n=1 Tax=Homarus americanus TaxID=6706 RepID=A0A8J5KB21_HOMAM|nr:Alpha-2-macroglobulin-like 3 [Homarus americanus]
MEERSEFKLVGEEGQEVAGERSVCLAAQDKKVVTVKLDMLALGDIKIGVSAFVDQQIPLLCGSRDDSIKRRDALVKPIKVEPEGFPRERTWTSYLCSQGQERVSGGEVVWEVEVPGTMVERSARAWVTVVADLLGLSLQYLRATGQDTPELTDKLIRFMNTGYQRQLLYLRDDGSFSVFGRADASGSTWLTAFVLKSFAQAQTFILVDESVLRKSRSWLGKKQGKDGCFLALGKVLHKHMKGGIVGKDSPVPLTAYVMISLMEAGEELHSPVVLSAAGCLAVDSSHHPYTLALKAYALALARLPTAQVALQLLLDQAVVTPDFMYWELPSRYGRSRAAEVETASYVILSMITLNAECFFQQATKIVQWITAQRNSRGGFSSTQDTVVALQALATYETHFYQGPVSVEARVTAAFLSHTFTVNESNKLLEQRVTLPVIPTTVRIVVGGQGCAVLQAVLRYNVPHPEPSDAFSLTVTTKVDRDPGCVTQSISACAAYHLADAISNMAVIEVNLVSGYVPINPETPHLTNDTARRYEVEGSKIFIYLEELTERETCVVVRVRREIVVENVKPSAVVVYDYYEPQFSVSQDYRLVAPEDCV